MNEKSFKIRLNNIFRFHFKTKFLFIKHFKLIEEINKNYKYEGHDYKVGDEVILKKHDLMRGEGGIVSLTKDRLMEISEHGFISPDFTHSYNKKQKTPLTVPVWNIQKDVKLKDYIINYSGATIKIHKANGNKSTKIIPYKKLEAELEAIKSTDFYIWNMEQTKEIRFLPSLARDIIDIGFIMNLDNFYGPKILENDIYNLKFNRNILKTFIPSYMIKNFIYGNRDDFTTNRESAIIYGIPVEFITGILVSKKIEKDEKELDRIKSLFPSCYVCNLNGKVIRV